MAAVAIRDATAADIARLAKEARPLVRSGGRWVALDPADLAAGTVLAKALLNHDEAIMRR